MRYLLHIVPFILLHVSSNAQKSVNFTHPDFDEITAHHQTIAVLPITSTIELRKKDMKDMTDGALYEMEEQFGFIVQNDIEHYFLTRKRKSGTEVILIDIRETNQTLYEAGVSFRNITDYSIIELAKILNVDAVIRGNITSRQPTSEGVADLVFSAFEIDLSTNKSRISLQLYDTEEQLLWQFEKSVGLPYGSVPQSTISPLLIKAARKLPYGKVN